MTITLPGWLEDLSWAVGAEFPQADEDALWRLTQAWTSAAAALRAMPQSVGQAGEHVLSALGGDPGAAFRQTWEQLGQPGDGFLDRLADACDELAMACDTAATEVEYAKMQYIAALVMLAVTIAALVAAAFLGGVSTAGIPVAIAAAQFAIRLILIRLLTAAVLGAGVMVAVDAVIQSIQAYQGHRNDWDWAKTRRSAEDGAIYGVVSGGVFLAAGSVAPRLMGNPLGLAGTSVVAGAAGSVAAPIVQGEIGSGHDLAAAMVAGAVGSLGPELARGRTHPEPTHLSRVETPDVGRLEGLGLDLDRAAPGHERVEGLPEVPEPRPPATDVRPTPRHVADDQPAREAYADESTLAGGPLAEAGPEPIANPITPARQLGPSIGPEALAESTVVPPTAPVGAMAGPSSPSGHPTPPPGGPATPPPGGAASPPLGGTSAPTAAGAAAGTAAAVTATSGTTPGTVAAGTSVLSSLHGAVDGLAGQPAHRPPDAADPSGGLPPATPGPILLTDAEAVRLVKDVAIVTPAGLAFFPAGDSIVAMAQAVEPTPGYVTLDLHGSPDGFYIDGHDLTASQFAAGLRELRDNGALALDGGTGIKLISCDTAVGGVDSPAAQLARDLGVEVLAPDRMIWTDIDGTEIIASPMPFGGVFVPWYPPDGHWHRFDATGAEILLDFDPSHHDEPIRRLPPSFFNSGVTSHGSPPGEVA